MKCIIPSILLIVSLTFPSIAQITLSLPFQDVSVRSFSGVAEFNTTKFFGEPGQPELPGYKCTVLLPPDADLTRISCSLDGLVETKLTGQYDVRPMPPFRNILGQESWPRNRNIVAGKDIAVYNQNALFPQNHVKIVDVGQLSCFKVVTVKVSQFRFNPVTKTLFQVKKGKLKVNYLIDPAYRAKRASTRIPFEVKKRLSRMVVNYDQYISYYESDYSFNQKELLAILIPEEDKGKLTKLDAFVEAKKQVTDFDVEVFTEDTWGGGTGSSACDNIRKWLQDNYQEMGMTYVLIIGESDANSSKVPMYFFQGYSSWSGHEDCETDYCYSQLTGSIKDDFIPELHVGRIPIYSNHSQIDEILQKSIDYFTSSPDEASWRYNALLGGPGYNSGSQTSWTVLNPAYHEFIEPYEPEWSAFRCYSSSYGTPEEADLVANDISPTWAAGSYSIISWGAHGSSTGASSTMSSNKTTSVGNEYPGFVMCGSCSNASISTDNNLSYAILKNCGMGAIGGTDYTVISGDLLWIKAFVGYLAVDSLTIGATHTELIINNCASSWLNRAPYVLYGDPSVGVYSYIKAPYISVNNPAEGDEFIVGTTVDITWSSNIEGKVSLYLVKGSDVVSTIEENVDNNGEYSWEIPEDTDVGSDYKIQMKGDTITSESKIFTIKKKPSIVLGTNEITIYLKQSETGDKKLKISNEGEGDLRYSVSLVGGSASLLINELFVPHDAFADGMEIWNRGTDCDLKGYKVEWKDNASTSGSYTFADSYPLKEGETMVIADESVGGNCITVSNLSWTNQDDGVTELSVAIYDPDGNCVDYIKTAGSSDTPPPGQWDGDGIATGSERLYRNKNEDGNTASDWSSADGEESLNEINDSQDMTGVGQYRLSFDPEEGTVGAVSDIDITLSFDSEGLENGDYYDTLEITHDDPDNDSPLLIYCKLVVGNTSILNTVNRISKVNMTWFGNRIYYQIPERMNNKKLSIKLYNAQGKLIRTFINGPVKNGVHTIPLKNENLASGLYLCQMKTEGFTKTVNVLIHK